MLKRHISKLNFHIQLLSDRKLVLAELDNYESEIFLPHIKMGRITLDNVIPGRNISGRTSNRETLHKGKIQHSLQDKLQHKMQHAAKSLPITKKYIIKLISNKNVVLVECNGYESEIFLPHIQSHSITMKRVSAKEIIECSRWHSNVENKLTVNPTILLEGLRGALAEVETIQNHSSSNQIRQKGGGMQPETTEKIKPHQYRFQFDIESPKLAQHEKLQKAHAKTVVQTSPTDKPQKNVSTVLVKRKLLKRLPHRDRGDCQFSSHFTNAIGALNGSRKLPKILASCAVSRSTNK